MKKKTLTALLLFPSIIFAQYQFDDLTLFSGFNPQNSTSTGKTVDTIINQNFPTKSNSTLSELSTLVPNMNFAGGTSNPKFFQIRGLGERSLYEGVPNASVGLYLNHLNLGELGTNYPIYDLAQVEVSKGPSATQYGANALAGSIGQQASSPLSPNHAELDYSSFNTYQGQVSIGGKTPHPKLSYRLSNYFSKSDGTIENTYLNRDDTSKIEEWSGRLNLHYQGSNYDADLLLTSFRQHNGYDQWSGQSDFITISDHPGRDDQKLDALSLKQEIKVSERTSLIATTNLGQSKELLSYDEDWGNNIFWNSVPGYNDNYNYFAESFRKRQNLSQEVRLDQADFHLGIYAQHFTEDSINKSFKNDQERLSKRIVGNFEKRVVALFSKKGFAIGDQWMLWLAGRLERSEMDYQDADQLHLTPKNNYVGGELTLEYLGIGQQILYSSLARGFKHGGFNISKELDSSKRYYDPEYLYNLEIGHKLNKKDFSVNNALFASYLTDAQVNTTSQDNPNDPNDFTYYIGNAAKSLHVGFENTVHAALTPSWSVDSSLSYLKAQYLNYSYEGKSLDHRDVAHAPNYQYFLGTSYQLWEELSLRCNIEGKDSFYFSNTHDQQSASYFLTNASIEKKFLGYTISLWTKNIFDRRYAIRGYYFANEPPAWENKLYVQNGMPRTFGIGIKGNF